MNILFGRRRSEKVFEKEPELRESFAQEVLDLEIDTNLNCTLSNIKALMELYTFAIEHYESIKNCKYLYYQERMQKLLSRPEVLKALSPPEEKPLEPTVKLPVERRCEKVLQNHKIEALNISQQIIENLKTQSDNLQNRIESRKKNRMSNSVRYRRSQEINQCDKSGGEARLNPIEVFEEQVEKIMEKFVEEKTTAKKEIEDKYAEYVRELTGMEGEIMQKVLRQLQKNMGEEIEESVRELEAKRNQAIAIARKALLNKC